jgi:hypothetical protein
VGPLPMPLGVWAAPLRERRARIAPAPRFRSSRPPLCSAFCLERSCSKGRGGNLAVSPLPKITGQVSTEQPATANDRPTIQTPRPTTSDILFTCAFASATSFPAPFRAWGPPLARGRECSTTGLYLFFFFLSSLFALCIAHCARPEGLIPLHCQCIASVQLPFPFRHCPCPFSRVGAARARHWRADARVLFSVLDFSSLSPSDKLILIILLLSPFRLWFCFYFVVPICFTPLSACGPIFSSLATWGPHTACGTWPRQPRRSSRASMPWPVSSLRFPSASCLLSCPPSPGFDSTLWK